VTSPSFSFRTDVQRVQMLAKHAMSIRTVLVRGSGLVACC
jgi:hypothetical protein